MGVDDKQLPINKVGTIEREPAVGFISSRIGRREVLERVLTIDCGACVKLTGVDMRLQSEVSCVNARQVGAFKQRSA